MAFPTDGFTVTGVDIISMAADHSFTLKLDLDGVTTSEEFVADVVAAVEKAVAAVRPGENVDTQLTYVGRKN